MPDENLIGLGRCPVCGQAEARFTITKSKLVCVTCRQRRCGIQLFCRTGDGDEKARSFLNGAAPTVPETIAAEQPEPTPIVAPEKTEKQKPKPAAPGWGILGALNG